MTKRLYTKCFGFALSLGLAGLALGPSTGCKEASCEEVCEQRNTCEGAEQISDCAAHCEAEATDAEAAGCTSEYDAKLSCQGTIDSCTSATFCAAQDAAYLKCVSDACAEDPARCGG